MYILSIRYFIHQDLDRMPTPNILNSLFKNIIIKYFRIVLNTSIRISFFKVSKRFLIKLPKKLPFGYSLWRLSFQYFLFFLILLGNSKLISPVVNHFFRNILMHGIGFKLRNLIIVLKKLLIAK